MLEATLATMQGLPPPAGILVGGDLHLQDTYLNDGSFASSLFEKKEVRRIPGRFDK